MNRLPLLALTLLAVPALAQTDLMTMAQAEATLKNGIAAARAQAATVAQTPASAQAAVVSNLICRGKSGEVAVEGRLEKDGSLFTSAAAGKSPLLDAKKGADLIDGRCGETAAAIASSLNYEVTPHHKWGQDILQLPKNALEAKAAFSANLHECDYDGDWHSSSDAALTCTLTAK